MYESRLWLPDRRSTAAQLPWAKHVLNEVAFKCFDQSSICEGDSWNPMALSGNRPQLHLLAHAYSQLTVADARGVYGPSCHRR